MQAIKPSMPTAGVSVAPELKQKPGFIQPFSNFMGAKETTELQNLKERLIKGGNFSPRELLLYQIRAGEFGLKIELVSKVADSFLSTVRKLQNPQ